MNQMLLIDRPIGNTKRLKRAMVHEMLPDLLFEEEFYENLIQHEEPIDFRSELKDSIGKRLVGRLIKEQSLFSKAIKNHQKLLEIGQKLAN